VVTDLVQLVEGAGRAALAAALREAYPYDTVTTCATAWEISRASLLTALDACEAVLSDLFTAYRAQLRRFHPGSQLYKVAGFEVMELMATADAGLYGVRMHHSNGSTSYFTRTAEGTECVNLSLRVGGVELWVGDLDGLRDEWRVGDKRLYEIGLQGRYNEIGEWKPLIYPGKWDEL